jgi:RimJ/RimL family protein N-acetyltransferase
MDIPTLTTQRLVLTAPSESHVDAFFEIYADVNATRYIPHARVQSRVGAWSKIATQLGHWQLRGSGFWTVLRKGSTEVVGNAGFLMPPGNPALEIGWIVSPSCWGRGYACEAAEACLEYGFSILRAPRIIARIEAENAASRALARKLGMQPDARLHAGSELCFSLDAPTSTYEMRG